MKHYLLPLLAAALLASGCASTPAPAPKAVAAPQAPVAKVDTSAIQEANAKAAIAAAEKSRDAAAAAGFEWRDTSQLIDDAKKALAEKEYNQAIKLANQAERQGNLAVKQGAIEAERLSKMK